MQIMGIWFLFYWPTFNLIYSHYNVHFFIKSGILCLMKYNTYNRDMIKSQLSFLQACHCKRDKWLIRTAKDYIGTLEDVGLQVDF